MSHNSVQHIPHNIEVKSRSAWDLVLRVPLNIYVNKYTCYIQPVFNSFILLHWFELVCLHQEQIKGFIPKLVQLDDNGNFKKQGLKGVLKSLRYMT